MRIQGHQDTEAGQQGHHRSTTVTDQRQWHADHRYQSAHHSGIDEDVDEERQRDAAGEQARESVLRFHRQVERAPHHEQIQ